MEDSSLGLLAAGAGLGLWWLLRQPSPDFTWDELLATSTGLDNDPTIEDRIRLIYLARRVLQPLRDEFGPLLTTSAYRSEAVNEAVGGSPTSYHRAGLGWDGYSTQGWDHETMANWLYSQSDLPLAEVIVERHTGHLHLAADLDGAPGGRNFMDYDGETYTAWTPSLA
tara:strand:- start:742 stop:1245 length:504 start_codon:yes stop_codon:yes gene_type:complete